MYLFGLLAFTYYIRGPGSSVGIETGYGRPRIESRWGRDFPHLFRMALGPTQPPVQWVPGLSWGVKSGRGVTLTPHTLLVPMFKNRVELYLYSPQGPSWPVKRVTPTNYIHQSIALRQSYAPGTAPYTQNRV
jgi:hypothetical protein